MALTFLVEDNAEVRKPLAQVLADAAGAHVIAFADGETGAVSWLRQSEQRWDLLVVDICLKEGSGLGVLAAASRRQPHQKVVVLSHFLDPKARERCSMLGANAVFDKLTELDSFFAYCSRVAAPRSIPQRQQSLAMH